MDSVTMNTPSSVAQLLVTITAWGPEPWAELSGGDISAEAKEVYNGGTADPDHLRGKRKTSDLVVRKPFYPRDKERFDALMPQVGSLRTEVVVQDSDPDFGPYGRPRVFLGQLSNLGMLGLKAEGGDHQTIEVTFSGSWARV